MLTIAGLLFAQSAAYACRGDPMLAQQIVEFRKDGAIEGTLIVEVTQTGPVAEETRYNLEFANVGTVVASDDLVPQSVEFQFDQSRLTVGCGWASNLRTWPGELLAVYLSKGENGRYSEKIVIPLSWAISEDPLVARIAAAEGIRGNSSSVDDIIRSHVRRIPRFDPVPVHPVPPLED